MSKQHYQMKIFYPNHMESFLSSITGNHAARSMMEETEWQNVQNVELTSRSRRNLGRWLEDPTSKANACS